MIADPLWISMPSAVAADESTELKIRTGCADAAMKQNKTAENVFIINRAGGT
jgi:hypothetical protein